MARKKSLLLRCGAVSALTSGGEQERSGVMTLWAVDVAGWRMARSYSGGGIGPGRPYRA